MKTGIALFVAGSLFSGSLFQFDLGLPSFHANQSLTQKAKIKKAKSTVQKQRNQLSRKAAKKAGKKAAGALIPFVGSVVTLSLAAEDYCDDLEQIIELQNILENTNESYNVEACIAEAKSWISSNINE